MHEKVKYSPTDLHSLMRKKLEISQTGSPNLLGGIRHQKPSSRRMVEIRPRRLKKKQIGSGATGQLTRLPEPWMLEFLYWQETALLPRLRNLLRRTSAGIVGGLVEV
jgi:hypothetical protein